jgi:hypothetical protein
MKPWEDKQLGEWTLLGSERFFKCIFKKCTERKNTEVIKQL